MVMLYFSGTGNSKYIAELFCKGKNIPCHSIEENINFGELIASEDVIGFCYPVYMSGVPRMMREFVSQHMKALKGKKIIIFSTQYQFSGDVTRSFAILFPKDYVNVIYTEHFFMPNNMNDVPILPVANGKSLNKSLEREKKRMRSVWRDIQNGKVKKRGFSIISRIRGLPRALLLGAAERRANRAVSIDSDCSKCGLCVKVCPMNNFTMDNEGVRHNHNCTMCYRCINLCPKKAISVLLPVKVKRQYKGIPGGMSNGDKK